MTLNTDIRAVPTIAKLTSTSGLPAVVRVLGYYAAGDGGGGDFVKTTSGTTANGGTIFAAAEGGSARWERILEDKDEIRAVWFGAVGDNSTNDTATIQAAMNYVLPLGKSLLFNGTHKITDALTVPSTAPSFWSMRGAASSVGGTKIVQYTNNKPIFKLPYFQHSINIENLGLLWNTQQTASHPNSYAVMFNTIDSTAGDPYTKFAITLRNLYIRYGYRGIAIDNLNGTSACSVWGMGIEDCHVWDMAGAAISLASPVAIGMPNNSLTNIEILQQNYQNVTEPQIILSAQTGFSSYNLDIEGARTTMLYIDSSQAGFHNTHIENVVLPAGSGSHIDVIQLLSSSDVTFTTTSSSGTTANTAWTNIIRNDDSTVTVQGWQDYFTTSSGPVLFWGSGTSKQFRLLSTPSFFGNTTLTRTDIYNDPQWLGQIEMSYPGDGVMSGDRGNADVTLTSSSQQIQLFNTPLTVARNVTLPTHVASTASLFGKRFRIVRGAGATGAFNINVVHSTTLKSLTAASTWTEVMNNGSGWFVIASGSL